MLSSTLVCVAMASRLASSPMLPVRMGTPRSSAPYCSESSSRSFSSFSWLRRRGAGDRGRQGQVGPAAQAQNEDEHGGGDVTSAAAAPSAGEGPSHFALVVTAEVLSDESASKSRGPCSHKAPTRSAHVSGCCPLLPASTHPTRRRRMVSPLWFAMAGCAGRRAAILRRAAPLFVGHFTITAVISNPSCPPPPRPSTAAQQRY